MQKQGPATIVATGSNSYVYDQAGYLIGEYDANQQVIEETVYLGDLPVAVLKQSVTGTGTNQTTATNVYYVYADHLDTPRVIMQASDNQMVWRWDNADPFGMLPPDENPSGLGVFTYNQRFPGQLYDKETNNFYNINRDYDPQSGRYIESDPIGLGGGLNTYAYVSGNPINKFDPDGLREADPWPTPSYPPNFPGKPDSPTSPNACPDDNCKHTITLTFERGICGPGDVACGMGLQAAGLEGPYYRSTGSNNYSWPCLLALGLFGKVGGVKAGNYAAGKAAGWAAGAAASENALIRGVSAAVGFGAEAFASPITTAAFAPSVIKALFEHCKCKKEP